jgi:hypothetical protein
MIFDETALGAKGVYPVKFAGCAWDRVSAGAHAIGDKVRIGGVVEEIDNVTTVVPYTASAVELQSYGNPLPEIDEVPTGILADIEHADPECNEGEGFESCLVRTPYAAVVDVAGFGATGRFAVSSTGALDAALTVDPAVPITYQPQLGDVLVVTGTMTQSGGEYRLVPREDADIVLTGITWTDGEGAPKRPEGFVGIAPNPFNPSTEISFYVADESRVRLTIFNLRGQVVHRLLDETLPGGQIYARGWTGTGDRGRPQASGVYFVKLSIGDRTDQVRKLMLIR